MSSNNIYIIHIRVLFSSHYIEHEFRSIDMFVNPKLKNFWHNEDT